MPKKNIPPSLPDTRSLIRPTEPIPARPVINFPTPVISDNILIEYVSAERGVYNPLPYGTLFDSVPHTAFQKSYPGFQLVFQTPYDVDGYWVKRVWCNSRTSQDTYNYSIDYQENNPAFPSITRLYVYPRASYNTDPVGPNGPLPPLTPDPVYPNALLVSEKMLNQTNPEEINSEFVTVARQYDVIPGPVVLTADFDAGVNKMVTTSKQRVLSSDTFDPSTVPLLLQCQESAQGEYVKLRAQSYFLELPATRTEYKTGKYPFPTLVTDITTTVVSLSTTPDRSFVEWYPSMRDDPNTAALYKTTTSFHSSLPTPDTIYVFATQNLVYKGISFSISINSVLNDEITMSATFTADPNYGDLAESITFPATTPSATEYLALIGTYVTVGSDITQWRGNVYTKVKTELLVI